MAYSTTNPPTCWTQSFGGQVLKEWSYKSADSIATVAGSSYFSNGFSLGMRLGDSIVAAQISTGSTYIGHARGMVNLVSTGAGATVTFAATST
jgi:hypothetical protein